MPRVTTTAEVSNPKRKGYDFRLDNQLFRAAIGPGRELQIQSSDVNDPGVNVKQNAEDFTSNLGRIYSRNNFEGGEGLDKAHRANGSPKDTTRFFDSKGVDVFHGDTVSSYHIHLLYTTVSKLSLSGSNNYLAQTTNGDMYVTDGTTIYKSTDDGDNWSTVTTGLTINHNFTGAAAVGDQVYFTTANGTSGAELILYNGTSWSELSHDQTSNGLTGVWFAKNQLFIAGKDATVGYLWAVTPIGKSWSSSDLAEADAIVTYENSFSVSQVVDAGAVVLAATTSGDIYSIKDINGTMTLKGQTNIPFEEVHSIAAAEGIVFFGTKEKTRQVGRFYRADVTVADDLYVLANRQLIREWIISGQDTTPKHMFASRDSVYVGIKESGSESYLWRYYLPTAGFARDLKMGAGGFVTGITQADGKFISVVAGEGVYQESSTYESEGYLITSPADFFTAESKQYVGVEIETETMQNLDEVEIYASTQFEAINSDTDSSWDLVLEHRSGRGGIENQLNLVDRFIIGKIVLKSADGATSPKLNSIQFRALARPELVVVQIPVNLSDRVERPYRKPIMVKNLGETIYQQLKTKEGSAVTLELFDPSEVIRGVVEQISYPVQNNPNIGSVTQYAILTVRGTRQGAFAPVTSANIFGVGEYAVMKFAG